MTAAVRARRYRVGEATTGVVSHGLAVVGVALMLTALAAGELRLDDLGLHASLGTFYYLGLILLPAASVLQFLRGTRASTWAIVAHIVLFIVIVWLTPLVLEGTPRFRTSYANFGDVTPLIDGPGLQPETFIYHNWPLFPLLMSVVVRAGVPVLGLLAVFPVLAMLAYVPALGVVLTVTESAARRARVAEAPRATLPAEDEAPPAASISGRVASFARRIRPTPSVAMALWILPIFNWTGQDYFSPQALAYLLFLVLLAVLADVALKRDGRLSPGRLSLILAVFTAIVATHVLTSLVALALLLTLSIARLVRRPTLVLTATAILVVWQVYVAAPFLDFYRGPLLDSLLSLGDFLQRNLGDRVQGSPGHSAIVRLRIEVTGAALLLGVGGLVLIGRRRPLAPVPRLVIAGVVAVVIVAPVTVYGGEMLIRALLFAIPFLAIVVAAALRFRPYMIAVALVLMLLAPVHVFTHFGNELYDYVSPQELEGFETVGGLGQANVYGGAPAAQFLNTTEVDYRNSSLPRGGDLAGVAGYLDPLNHAWANPKLPLYVAVSRGDDAALRLFHDAPGFKAEVRAALDDNPEFEIVFDRPDFVLYRWTPTEAPAP